MTTRKDTATAASLLARCEALGIGLQARDGRLRFHGRDDDLTPELAAKLQAHAAELLEIIGGGPEDGDAGPVAKPSELPGDGPQDLQPIGAEGAQDDIGGDGPRAQPQDLPGGDRRGADGPQDAGPSDSDAGEWLDVTDPDGRRCLVRSDAADLQVIDLQPCPVCGGLERWQDLAGEWHCERCSPRTRAARLRELAQRLRERHERNPGR